MRGMKPWRSIIKLARDGALYCCRIFFFLACIKNSFRSYIFVKSTADDIWFHGCSHHMLHFAFAIYSAVPVWVQYSNSNFQTRTSELNTPKSVQRRIIHTTKEDKKRWFRYDLLLNILLLVLLARKSSTHKNLFYFLGFFFMTVSFRDE